MSDYSLELDCGCINFCRCEERRAKAKAVYAGFNPISIRVSHDVYECKECKALVLDYVNHTHV